MPANPQVTDEINITEEMVAKAAYATDVDPLVVKMVLAAALADHVVGWRTMDSAPKDGTWILAYFNDHVVDQEFYSVVRFTEPNGTGGQYGDFVWQTIESNCGYYAERLATHWMPLPAAPLPQKEG